MSDATARFDRKPLGLPLEPAGGGALDERRFGLSGRDGSSVAFVLFQGVEWVRLIGQGLTLTSSQLGAFFYLIVGAHALHAAAALAALVVCWRAMREGRLRASAFGAVQLFWYFVVLMWPVIYWQVYL